MAHYLMAELAKELLVIESPDNRVYVMQTDYSGFDLSRYRNEQLYQWQKIVYPDELEFE